MTDQTEMSCGFTEERRVNAREARPAGYLHASRDGNVTLCVGHPLLGEVRPLAERPPIHTPCPVCRNLVHEAGLSW